MANVKLIIWDLDNTLWSGILAEGDVQIEPNVVEMIKYLNSIGIINSICSKNEQSAAKNKLTEHNLWNLFIFPIINYKSKGHNVKTIIELCKLRNENVLFVDDLFANRNEVLFYNKNIQVSDETIINSIKADTRIKVGKSRLEYYKNMEIRNVSLKQSNDNTDFLRQSDIRIKINNHCIEKIERIYELINRTNQLNFTKKRLTMHELKCMLKKIGLQSSYIEASDKYGNYGIIGFYTYDTVNSQMLHFLFSCRVLGIGIESYIFRKLKQPKISSTFTDSYEDISYISEVELKTSYDTNKKKPCVLFRGGCDIEAVSHYLRNDLEITNDYGNSYNQTQLYYALYGHKLAKNEVNNYIDTIPFVINNTFKTKITDRIYDYIVVSLLVDYSREYYENKTTGVRIYYEITNQLHLRKIKKHDDNMFYIKQDYKTKNFINDLDLYKLLCEFINCFGQKQNIIFINGAEINGLYDSERHIQYNKILDRVILENENVNLVDIRKFVHSTSELRSNDKGNIRHYTRNIYHNIATELKNIIGV
jgi:FkbH-like protein